MEVKRGSPRQPKIRFAESRLIEKKQKKPFGIPKGFS